MSERRRAARVFATVWAVLAALTVLWSFATPISAAPDEPAHLVKAAAVVRGQWTGPASSEGNIVTVPLYIAWTHAVTCFAFNDEATADCDDPMPGDPGEPTESRTTAGLYNPVYYLLVGWPSLIADDSWGIYAMRVVSAILTTLFAAAAAALMSFWSRRFLPWVSLVTLTTPMLLFLGGVINPNALETTTTLAVVVAMVSIVRFPHRVPSGIAYGVLIAGAAIGLNTRGLSPLWFLLAIGIPLILAGRERLKVLFRSRATIIAMCAIGVAALFAVGWTVGTASLTAAVTDPDAENLYPGTGQPALYGFLFILERTLSFGGQMIGLFGWMDTMAPTVVMFVWTVLIGGLVIGALVVARGRRLASLLVAIGALVLLPALIQGAYVTAGGYIWQGRYAFPLLAIVLVLAALVLAETVRPIPAHPRRRLTLLIVAGTAAAHFYVFAFVLKRYATGIDSTWLQFVQEPAWSAPGGNLVLVGLYGLVVVASAVFVGRGLLAAPDEPDELKSGPDDRTGAQSDGDTHPQLAG
jgi:hypothetical protein